MSSNAKDEPILFLDQSAAFLEPYLIDRRLTCRHLPSGSVPSQWSSSLRGEYGVIVSGEPPEGLPEDLPKRSMFILAGNRHAPPADVAEIIASILQDGVLQPAIF